MTRGFQLISINSVETKPNQFGIGYSKTLNNKYFLCCFSILKVLEHEVNAIFFYEIITIITIQR